MKPNTLAMGFYTKAPPINTLEALHSRLMRRHKAVRYLLKDTSLEKYDLVNSNLPPLRETVSVIYFFQAYMYTMYIVCFSHIGYTYHVY